MTALRTIVAQQLKHVAQVVQLLAHGGPAIKMPVAPRGKGAEWAAAAAAAGMMGVYLLQRIWQFICVAHLMVYIFTVSRRPKMSDNRFSASDQHASPGFVDASEPPV